MYIKKLTLNNFRNYDSQEIEFGDNINIILKAKEKGAYLQMNKGSILGRYGQIVKDISYDLLTNDAYTFIGSDAHHPNRRTPMMYDAYQYIREYFGRSYAKDLFENNARKYLGIGGNEDEY